MDYLNKIEFSIFPAYVYGWFNAEIWVTYPSLVVSDKIWSQTDRQSDNIRCFHLKAIFSKKNAEKSFYEKRAKKEL